MADIHLWDNTAQITHETVRVGFMYDPNLNGLLYFEWVVVDRDNRNRRIWKNTYYPGMYSWLMTEYRHALRDMPLSKRSLSGGS